MKIQQKKEEKKTRFRLVIRELKTRDFWVEWFALYTSILIVTIVVQYIIIQVDIEILVFCLSKSLATTIINVIVIMLGRRTEFVQRHWFIETLLYTIASMPYAEITMIYVYTSDLSLFIEMVKWYATAYFVMGLGIKKYLRLTKRFVRSTKPTITKGMKKILKKTGSPASYEYGVFAFLDLKKAKKNVYIKHKKQKKRHTRSFLFFTFIHMKYVDILDHRQIEQLTITEHLSQSRKEEILQSLNEDIDERFKGFKHCIISTGRKSEDQEPLENEKYMDPFDVDQDKIQKSKAFRRLGDKAQVLPNAKEENIHIRNRLIHSIEVARLSATFCDMLNHKFAEKKIPIRLNKHLCIAAGLGHDIGHTPLGHIGEDFIFDKTHKEFKHNIYSTVVAQEIERKGNGLNLSNETLYAILNHTTNHGNLFLKENPQEEAVVMIMDKIAYVLSDFNDGLRQGYIKDLHTIQAFDKLGKDQRTREYILLNTLADETIKAGYITFGESEIGKNFVQLRTRLFEEYYYIVNNERKDIGYEKLDTAYEFFKKERHDVDPVIAISLLTDVEVIKITKILKKNPNYNYDDLIKEYHLGVSEILPYIAGRKIDRQHPTIDARGYNEHSKKAPMEREKKFLINELPKNIGQYEYDDIIQGYLAIGQNSVVRIRKKTNKNGSENYTRTIKEDKKGGTSKEYEEKISKEKYESLFPHTKDIVVNKRRYYIPLENNLTAEVDIFGPDDRAVEVEFTSDEQMKSFTPPTWFGKEVTGQKQYENDQRALTNKKKHT